MSIIEEIHLAKRPLDGWRWFARLKPFADKLLRLPGFDRLIPTAQLLASVATPANRISFRSNPTIRARGDCATLTLLSANLCHDWPRHRHLLQRLEAVAQLIESESVDIALLQEVSRTPQLRADEWLSRRLGMAYVYAPANGNATAVGFEEGLAILSRFPLSMPTLTKLMPGSPITHRLGIGARVNAGCGALQVFSVHLSLTPSRNAAQMEHLHSWTSAVAGAYPAIIGGDFNTHEDSPQIAQAQTNWIDTFRHLHPDADGSTHELSWPWGRVWRRRRLDYLFLRPQSERWQVLSTRHLDAPGGPHSDHRAVVTRLSLGA